LLDFSAASISAKSKEFSEIKRILVKLEKLSIKSEDPLNLIIDEIKEYLGEND
jgi:nitrate reductase NapAB chaperone NapD